MDAKGSRTALMVAALRATASARPEPICSDPWAARLAGDEGFALAERFLAASPSMELWLALRTAVIDERVRAFVGSGVRQVVLLGAGLDSRAARLAAAGVRFFEVDAPASQAHKLAALAGLPDYPKDAATHVSCDFEKEDFLDRLLGAAFDATAPALFVWEGVACYLTEPAVRATLRRVATGCDPRSAIVFDYVGKKLATGRATDAGSLAASALVSDLSEPITWGTDDVVPLLHDAGFRRARTMSFDEAALNRTGTYDRARFFRFQHVALASVAGEVEL
jgi:methyltransferase (TIGR00027 family)